MRSFQCLIVFLLVVLGPRFSRAADAALTLTRTGDGVYALQGSSLQNVAALDITITYDATILANPRVDQGSLLSGALFIANPNTPGTIRIAAVQAGSMNASGTVATIAFDVRSPGSGVTSLSAAALDPDGKRIALTASLEGAGAPLPAAAGANPGQTASVAGGTGFPAAQPTVVIPTGPQRAPETTTRDDEHPHQETGAPLQEPADRTGGQEKPAPVNRPEALRTARTDSAAAVASQATYTLKSAFDRFREYRGKRTPEALLSLLGQDGQPGFSQDPAVAMSDGVTQVAVTVVSLPSTSTVLRCEVTGGTIKRMTRDKNRSNTWIIHVIPEKNAYDVRLTLRERGMTRVLPILATPKINADLDASGAVTRNDFIRYLASNGKLRLVQYPVTAGTKRIRYLDDYVYTANYLAAARIPKKSTEQKKPKALRPSPGPTHP